MGVVLSCAGWGVYDNWDLCREMPQKWGELKAIHHKEALDKRGCVHETNSFCHFNVSYIVVLPSLSLSPPIVQLLWQPHTGSPCSSSPAATVSLHLHHPSHTGHFRRTLSHQTRLTWQWIRQWWPPEFTTKPPELPLSGSAAVSSCCLPAKFPRHGPATFPLDGPTTFPPDDPAELPPGIWASATTTVTAVCYLHMLSE